MALHLMGQVHPLPAGFCEVNRPFLPVDVHRPGGDAYPVPGGNWTQLTISLAKLYRTPAGLGVLSMANRDEKAMDTLGRLWKSDWEVFLSSTAHGPF